MLYMLFLDLLHMISPYTTSGVGAPAIRQALEALGYTAGGVALFAALFPRARKKVKARQRLKSKLLVGSQRLSMDGVYYV